MLQFIKPYIPTQVTMTWQWAQELTLPFPAEHLPQQAGFSSGSHHALYLSHQARTGISGTSTYASIKWAHESYEPSTLGTL